MIAARQGIFIIENSITNPNSNPKFWIDNSAPLSFFDFLNRLYNRNLNEYIALTRGENKILHKGQKVTDTISFKVDHRAFVKRWANVLPVRV